MKRIVFRMEVNIYDGIIYCPYDHVASFLTTEYLITVMADDGPASDVKVIRVDVLQPYRCLNLWGEYV